MRGRSSGPTFGINMSYESDVYSHKDRLYSFACKLTRNKEAAEDLLQTVFLRALTKRDQFETGTNLAAWLMTIMRNEFYTQQRRVFRSVEDPDEKLGLGLRVPPNQIDRLTLLELEVEMKKLPASQYESLVLVSIEGLSYEDAASRLGVKAGTVKSRVSRARTTLKEILEFDVDTDSIQQGVMTNDYSSYDSSRLD